MADNFKGDLADIQMAAAELIARVKAESLAEVSLPIVDGASVWEVSVKQLGIAPSIDLSRTEGGK